MVNTVTFTGCLRGTRLHILVFEMRVLKTAEGLCVVCAFQLSCCGKGQGTSFLTHFTDKLGLTDLCPSSGTSVVSAIIHLATFMHTYSKAGCSWKHLSQDDLKKPLVWL